MTDKLNITRSNAVRLPMFLKPLTPSRTEIKKTLLVYNDRLYSPYRLQSRKSTQQEKRKDRKTKKRIKHLQLKAFNTSEQYKDVYSPLRQNTKIQSTN